MAQADPQIRITCPSARPMVTDARPWVSVGKDASDSKDHGNHNHPAGSALRTRRAEQSSVGVYMSLRHALQRMWTPTTIPHLMRPNNATVEHLANWGQGRDAPQRLSTRIAGPQRRATVDETSLPVCCRASGKQSPQLHNLPDTAGLR